MYSKIIQAGELAILDHEVGSTLPRILTTILSPLRQRDDLKKTDSSSTIVSIEKDSRISGILIRNLLVLVESRQEVKVDHPK